MSGWPHSRLGACSHADRNGPGQTRSPPWPSMQISCEDCLGPGKAGHSAGTGRGQTHVWGFALAGGHLSGVCGQGSKVNQREGGEPTSGSSALGSANWQDTYL